MANKRKLPSATVCEDTMSKKKQVFGEEKMPRTPGLIHIYI